MLKDVVRPETWDELNDFIKEDLNLPQPVRARIYRGLAQAVFEITQSTAHFMTHKKAIGVLKGQSPLFDGLLPYYYKETYEVHVPSHLQFSQSSSAVKEWVDGLKKDNLFVLYAEDHPITGEIYPFAEELNRLLNEKKIYSFCVSHARHLYHEMEIKPYTVRLCSYGEDIAVAVMGERFRTPPMLAQQMFWDLEADRKKIADRRTNLQMNEKLVRDFEVQMRTQAKTFFADKNLRLFDRAVLVFSDVGAELLAQQIFKKMGIPSEQGWKELATTNMCYWSGTKMFKQWWEPAPSSEDLRGLLVIGLNLLSTKDFAKRLITSYEEVKQQQSWDV